MSRRLEYTVARKWITIAIFILSASACGGILNILGVWGTDIAIESLAVISVFSLFSVLLIGKLGRGMAEHVVLFTGYVMRIVILVSDCNFFKGSDAEMFWLNAVELYNGRITDRRINYESILAFEMQFTGENRLLLQYINVLFWLLAAMLLSQCLDMLQIKGKPRLIAFTGFAFLPMYFFLTVDLLRESAIVFLNLASFCFFLKWFQRRKFGDFMLAESIVFCSMLLHSGAIGLGCAYGIAYAVIEKHRGIVRISAKTFVILILGMAAAFVIFVSPYHSIATSYIPKLDSVWELQNRYFDRGGSNYLRNMPYTENLFIFAAYTIVRIVYFYISPVPWEWRGITDMFAFCADSMLPIVTVTFGIFSWIKDRKNRGLTGFFLLCIVIYGLVFAWGVSNGGTAMRHRNKLIGIELLFFAFCLKRRTDLLSGYDI